jgi:hypothetical protein
MKVEIGTAQFLFWEYINPNFIAVWYEVPGMAAVDVGPSSA